MGINVYILHWIYEKVWLWIMKSYATWWGRPKNLNSQPNKAIKHSNAWIYHLISHDMNLNDFFHRCFLMFRLTSSQELQVITTGRISMCTKRVLSMLQAPLLWETLCFKLRIYGSNTSTSLLAVMAIWVDTTYRLKGIFTHGEETMCDSWSPTFALDTKVTNHKNVSIKIRLQLRAQHAGQATSSCGACEGERASAKPLTSHVGNEHVRILIHVEQ